MELDRGSDVVVILSLSRCCKCTAVENARNGGVKFARCSETRCRLASSKGSMLPDLLHGRLRRDTNGHGCSRTGLLLCCKCSGLQRRQHWGLENRAGKHSSTSYLERDRHRIVPQCRSSNSPNGRRSTLGCLPCIWYALAILLDDTPPLQSGMICTRCSDGTT